MPTETALLEHDHFVRFGRATPLFGTTIGPRKLNYRVRDGKRVLAFLPVGGAIQEQASRSVSIAGRAFDKS